MTDEPTARWRALDDRATIVELAARYAMALDTRDWPALAALFTADATWEYEGAGLSLRGPAEIVAMISGSLLRLDATQHLVGNHVVTLHGDEADHVCYTQAQHVRAGTAGGDTFLGGVRYTDRLRRTDHGWRFTGRVLSGMWRTGNPAVLDRSDA